MPVISYEQILGNELWSMIFGELGSEDLRSITVQCTSFYAAAEQVLFSAVVCHPPTGQAAALMDAIPSHDPQGFIDFFGDDDFSHLCCHVRRLDFQSIGASAGSEQPQDVFALFPGLHTLSFTNIDSLSIFDRLGSHVQLQDTQPWLMTILPTKMSTKVSYIILN